MINKDFLKLSVDDIQYPANRTCKLDVVFMSPPWGGIGYNLLSEYKLDYLFPAFKEVVKRLSNFQEILSFLA